MFIVPPVERNYKDHELGEKFEWEYLVYDENELKPA